MKWLRRKGTREAAVCQYYTLGRACDICANGLGVKTSIARDLSPFALITKLALHETKNCVECFGIHVRNSGHLRVFRLNSGTALP